MAASKKSSKDSEYKYAIETSSQFRRDLKKSIKQGRSTEVLEKIMKKLARGKALAQKYKDHPLHSNWKGYRDCHVENDWVLIYLIESTTIRFERIGSHSEIFG
jgi:mRNA interferase YafQ